MASARAGARRQRPVRVAVASEHVLVSEAVVAALRNRNFDPLLVSWPKSAPATTSAPQRPRPTRRHAPPDVGLLLSDLSNLDQVDSAVAVVAGLPAPWLVMAGIPRGPAWGALYEGGARLVVPSVTGIAEIADLLGDLVTGGGSLKDRRERRDLIRRWRAFAAQRIDVAARLKTLTEREGVVLQQLHQGNAVRDIAERSEVTESTVRSQVKAILKKLDVNSQMAAVAAYESVLTDSTEMRRASR
jgi:DNA-binding NarL/FixJ family response regulator